MTRSFFDVAWPVLRILGTDSRDGRRYLRIVVAIVFVFGSNTIAMPTLGNDGPADPAVTVSTGSAAYRIPIRVPPGPRGLVPKLTLVYTSHQGDGPFGVGWGLGLGEVACSIRFGVPNYAYGSCKRFELNGQLLTRDGTTDSYHSFIETFQRIEYLSASKSWQVTNPDGTIFRYGVDPDARVLSGVDVARWLLSEIQDPSGNLIFFSYDDTTDPGTRYPSRITYGAGASKGSGKRLIEFVFGERPDPIHDFAGGIERRVTKRLTDIRVSSYGVLVRRYAFGYDGRDENGAVLDYTTGRSRLAWSQIFGDDCDGVVSGCTGLPREEYEYTDSYDDGTTQQYSKFVKDQNYVVDFAGNLFDPAQVVRVVDVNGDGLLDLIKGGIGHGFLNESFLDPADYITVALNTGTGFSSDPAWTAALHGLEVERPRADFTQIRSNLSTSVGQDVLHWGQGNIGLFHAEISTVKYSVADGWLAGMSRPDARYSGDALADHAAGGALPGWIEGMGRLFFTDVNSDGLADIVVSVRLGGVDEVLQPNGNPIVPELVQRVPGRVVRMVYRNTGNPAVGWVEDEQLAAGLPPFGIVQFESAYGTETRIPFGVSGTGPTSGTGMILAQNRRDACSVRGLYGLYVPPSVSGFPASLSPDVCINLVNLDPRFQDLNGDGVLDLMVLELDDSQALYQGYSFFRGDGAPPLPTNHARSRAWIQVPDADAGEDRWVRASQYDLPNATLQTSEIDPRPFAHSQPQLRGLSDPPSGCPRPTSNDNWHNCAPLSFNVNLGVQLVDLNRDGLTDVIWSRYASGGNPTNPPPGFPVTTQGVLLNTGTGWCSSGSEMAVYVQSQCPHAAIYEPPRSDYPTLSWEPRGFAYDFASESWPSGLLADFNADGFLDYIQMQPISRDGVYHGYKVWLFDPSGASEPMPDMWIRDARYDLDVDVAEISVPGVNDLLVLQAFDINGDGAVDVVGDDLREANGNQQILPQSFISQSRHSDLLRLVRNGRGGQIAFSYESAITQRDSTPGGLEIQANDHAMAVDEALDTTTIGDVVRWTSTPVVSEVRIASPNRKSDLGESTFGPPLSYRYAHPRFCMKSRSGLGFRVVQRTRAGGEVVTSQFYQMHGRAGKTASVVVSDNGVDMHSYEEVWEIQPQVPAWIPGSIDHAEVHLGRLAEVRSMNLYEGGETGAQLIRTLHYDDIYGYNFVGKTVESRPTATVVSLRKPGSDEPSSIFGLLVEMKTFDHEGVSFSDLDFQKHTLIGYQLGLPSNLTEMVKARGDSGPGTAESHSMSYDGYGNLTSETVHAPSGDRVTSYCYDGDERDEGVAWCRDFGQDSHSVRVGVLDAAGGVTIFTPDAGTGSIFQTDSTYTDEPSLRVESDVFGRPVESFVRNGTDWQRTAKMVYDDVAQPPVVERFDYPEAGISDGDAIWSSVIFDGFGDAWKEIAETPSGFVATLIYHDSATRTVRKSLPIACADALCEGLDGDTQPFATRMRMDAIGRPLREDTPHGFSVFEYSSITKTSGPGLIGTAFDGILKKNGNGDLTRRSVDRDRVAWVEECGNTVSPDATDLDSTFCGGPDFAQTFYSYEATGELSTIYDARAVSPYADPVHYLRYRYDTLGRVLQIDDPALSGPGHSLTTYDTYGNIHEITNARLQKRTHSYDVLDRLTGITTPGGETNYAVSYRPNERQPSGDSSDDYQRTISFDNLGRVQKEHMSVRNASGSFQSFHTDYAYDLVGRVTEILHPAKYHDSVNWTDTIVRYEYDQGYLVRVCDPGDAADCGSATNEYVRAVGFDSLGRRASITLPGGARTTSYTADTHRLEEDRFVSSTYQYTRKYEAYDGMGNILSITGSEAATRALDMNESYAYDPRNRIKEWTKEGHTYAFEYDVLGNLTTHAGDAQVYDDPNRPHAIQRRNLASSSPIQYAYDDDGNVESILGGATSQYFEFDSANRIVCLSKDSTICETRVAYDVNGRRVAEYPFAGNAFNAYIGDTFLYENRQAVAMANVEIMIGGERIALKRFNPQLRGETTSLSDLHVPGPWTAGGLAGVGLLFIAWGSRSERFELVQRRPIRAGTALGAAASLLIPAITGCAVPLSGACEHYWEISDPLGTGMVIVDEDGERMRHQVFTPFGRVHDEVGTEFRTFYGGHRRNEDTGMFFMQARWYDPGSGRFLSVDPVTVLGSPQSHNPYSYVQNNPINGFDRTGMLLETVEESTGDLDMEFDDAGKFGPGNPNGGTHSASLQSPSSGSAGFTSNDVSGDPGGSSEFGVGANDLDLGGLDAFSGNGISDGGRAGEFVGAGPSVDFGGFTEVGTGMGHSLGGLGSAQMASASPASGLEVAGSFASGAASSGSGLLGGPGNGGPEWDSGTQSLVAGLNVLARSVPSSSTILSLQGGVFLAAGTVALFAAAGALTAGGLAVFTIAFVGFAPLAITATAGGALVLGVGLVTVGGANLAAAGVLRRRGQ